MTTSPGPHSGDDTFDLIDDALATLAERRGAWIGDDLTAITLIASLIDQAERCLPELVTNARLNGHTWDEIARALATSPDQARLRYGPDSPVADSRWPYDWLTRPPSQLHNRATRTPLHANLYPTLHFGSYADIYPRWLRPAAALGFELLHRATFALVGAAGSNYGPSRVRRHRPNAAATSQRARAVRGIIRRWPRFWRSGSCGCGAAALPSWVSPAVCGWFSATAMGSTSGAPRRAFQRHQLECRPDPCSQRRRSQRRGRRGRQQRVGGWGSGSGELV